MTARPAFPPIGITKSLLANPYFWSRVHGFVGRLDLEEVLEVTDESFQEFADLVAEHGIAETEDDEVIMTSVSVPLYASGGFTWAVELYDNGDDVGVIHWLLSPEMAEPLRLAVWDAHPMGPALRWEEAEKLFAAITRDERNAAAGIAPISVLLLWSAIGLTEHDSRDAIRVRLAGAWKQSGLVSAETAEQVAFESSKRPAARWKASSILGWETESGYRSLREQGFSEHGARVFRQFLVEIGAA